MINILYVFDDNYAPHAGISILSLFQNASSEIDICVYCVGMDVSKENKCKIDELTSASQKVIWVDAANSIECINSCDTGYWNGSKATWLKVFALWDLPAEVETILYIDSDTIVTGDISGISEVCLDDHPTAQVFDSLGNTYGKKILNLDCYYNAGIILFNVSLWRKEGFKEAFLNHLKANVNKYWDNEQGLLNDFFRGNIITLPLHFNRQGFLDLFSEKVYLSVYNDFPFYTEMEIVEAKNNPVINHFFRVFGDYPWEKGNKHPMTKLYEEYKEKSPWKDLAERKIRGGFVFRIEKMLYCILPKKMYLKIYRWIVERKI